jgi:hypothetical protein
MKFICGNWVKMQSYMLQSRYFDEIAQVNLIREVQKHCKPEVWKKVAFKEGLHEGLVWDKDLQLTMVRSRQYRLNQG